MQILLSIYLEPLLFKIVAKTTENTNLMKNFVEAAALHLKWVIVSFVFRASTEINSSFIFLVSTAFKAFKKLSLV